LKKGAKKGKISENVIYLSGKAPQEFFIDKKNYCLYYLLIKDSSDSIFKTNSLNNQGGDYASKKRTHQKKHGKKRGVSREKNNKAQPERILG